MSMFDYVRCEVPLPDDWNARNLQTKDFDCDMVTYTITKDGRLMLDNQHDANFHGVVNFYGSEGLIWHEYNAKFTDGQLVGIDLVPDDEDD